MSQGWWLTDLPVPNGPTVLSTFSCGGGSSMGYKLAGCRVIGALDIDPQMMGVYQANLPLEDYYTGPIGQVATDRPDLIDKWRGVDILDGSPPCTSFSTSGLRDATWGQAKKFREGQTVQVLDRLFFDYLDLAAVLQPRVFVAENVYGMAQGKARGYVRKVVEVARDYGYDVQVLLVRAQDAGVPQLRRRIIFLGRRCDLGLPPVPPIPPEPVRTVGAALAGLTHDCAVGGCTHRLAPRDRAVWDVVKRHGSKRLPERLHAETKYTHFGARGPVMNPAGISPAIGTIGRPMRWDESRYVTDDELFRLFTFPDDYTIPTGTDALYVCGMSVPPFLMRQVAGHVRRHWFPG